MQRPNHRPRRSWRRYRPRTVLVTGFALALALAYVAREPLLVTAARLLTIDDSDGRAEYLVVLGGGTETRPFAAAALYRRDVAPKVLIFRQEADRATSLGLSPTSDELCRKVLEIEGVHPGAIERVPGVVGNTWDEARLLRRFLETRSARRIIIVTSAEHTRRARWVFRTVFSGLPVEVRMAPARDPRFDETNWWKDDNGTLAYLHEYLKLPYYWACATLPLSCGGGGEG